MERTANGTGVVEVEGATGLRGANSKNFVEREKDGQMTIKSKKKKRKYDRNRPLETSRKSIPNVQ